MQRVEGQPVCVLLHRHMLRGRASMTSVLPDPEQDRRLCLLGRLQPGGELPDVSRRAARVGIAGIEHHCGIRAVLDEVIRREGEHALHLLRISDAGVFKRNPESPVWISAGADEIE